MEGSPNDRTNECLKVPKLVRALVAFEPGDPLFAVALPSQRVALKAVGFDSVLIAVAVCGPG